MPHIRLHLLLVLVAFSSSLSAFAADAQAGKAKVVELCVECHRPTDWSGESQAALESLIRDIIAGKVTHSKRVLRLSNEDAANIAAYWTSGRK